MVIAFYSLVKNVLHNFFLNGLVINIEGKCFVLSVLLINIQFYLVFHTKYTIFFFGRRENGGTN